MSELSAKPEANDMQLAPTRTGARAKTQPPQSGGGFCPSWREAARREQAERNQDWTLRKEYIR